ncbi:MAG TPA: group II intron reverse transcriptase/maturase [Rhodopila sp.]|jgi:RNA-directed DNA polymerase
MSLQTPELIRTLQRKLYDKAKREPGFRFYILYDKVYRADILRHAYDLGRANDGAPGVDRTTFETIEAAGLENWLTRLGEELRTKTYRCQAVRRVMIPKPGGGERPLGIPTIRDRVVQTAAKLVLEPIFEADLEPAAFGYRPKRSATDAIQLVLTLLRQGYTDVVDADLSKYFDTIPHDELMQSIARRIVDADMLRLIKQWLKAPVETTDGDGTRRMQGGKASRLGVPQGGVISPLVANLYMNRFLKHWRQSGRGEAWQAHVINYADDFVILSRGHAAEALAWTDRVMTRLGLTLNRTKTRLCDARSDRFDFLGYSFGPHCFRQTGRRYIGASPSKKSVQRLKDKVGAMLVPGNKGRWDDVRDALNRMLRGWGGYFSPGSHYATDKMIEAHLYDRVRNFLVRRHTMPSRGIGPFTMEAVFGEMGVQRMRHCRRSGVMS